MSFAENCVCHVLLLTRPQMLTIDDIGKEKKKVKATQLDTEAQQTVKTEDIRAALLKVRDEELPKTQEEKEQYFLASVDMGERLCLQG